MVCPKCGAENSENVKFCNSCGVSFTEDGTGSTGTSIGLDQNVAAMLSYMFGWLSGLIILSLEKENDFVRFHAVQSVITFGGLFLILAAVIMFSFLPFVGVIAWLLFVFLGWPWIILVLVLWALLMYKAYRGQRYKLKWAGNYAEQYM